MKALRWQLGWVAVCAVLGVAGGAAPVFGATEQDQNAPGDRLERLERRVNEIAQRQEQLMRRLGAQPERQAPIAEARSDQARRDRMFRDRIRPGERMQPLGGPPLSPAPPPTGPAPSGKHLKDLAGLIKLIFLVAIIFNILIAIWIFSDIRKRGEGSGIFVALALLAGVPAAIIYAIVRIGDRKP